MSGAEVGEFEVEIGLSPSATAGNGARLKIRINIQNKADVWGVVMKWDEHSLLWRNLVGPFRMKAGSEKK